MENILKIKKSIFIIPCILISISCTGPYTITTPPPRFKTKKQSQLWHHSQTFLGIPYRFGGSSKAGMDCSGLVCRLYMDVYDTTLSHNTSELYQQGYAITLGVLEIGDLVFFDNNRNRIPDHVGVYLGHGNFIHTSSRRGVILSKLSDPYYQQKILGARRIRK